ncbi:unnamed protein product [Phytophthora fragariaefolia]|uniref:Unnamed protein product n=1 Tax=Phytophthora fragariaefolia TaxID=1490495 RepID=A0A9W7CIR2_9STRA|nr:unnamed protein product [Phytophthora fragariaefolia]
MRAVTKAPSAEAASVSANTTHAAMETATSASVSTLASPSGESTIVPSAARLSQSAQDEDATESRQTPPSRRCPTQRTPSSSSSSTARVSPLAFGHNKLTVLALLRDMVEQLQEIWGNINKASAVTWRMWANEIMSNLDRSTWERAVFDAPPIRLERYISPADGQVHEHLTHLSRSTRVALDTINYALADNAELNRDWAAFGRRLGC